MRKVDVIRAWKDPVYRATLTPEELAELPSHPSGALELQDEQLRGVSAAAETTAQTCTEFSFNNFRRCCPR